jgi:hypothetical protein
MSFVTVNLVKFYHDYLVDQKLVCIFAITIVICLKGRNQTNEFTNNIIYEKKSIALAAGSKSDALCTNNRT